jgi:hypothetical protein
MVEVVTSEEFAEFRKSIEERLEAIESKLNDIIKDVNEKHEQTQADVEEVLRDLNKRFEDLDESSKGFIDRLREAIRPRTAEPPPERIESDPIENTEKTLGRVAEVIMRCPNFFDWDWCQDNCPMYLLCDDIASVQDISRLSQKDSIEKFKGILKRLEASLYPKREEHSEDLQSFST